MDDFDAFVRTHWERLHAAVSRTARRYRQEPDDVLQEALLRAYASRESFESEQHAINWVVRVARDLLCDQRRSWYGQRVTVSADLPDTALGAAPDPADVVVGRDAGRAVLRAVGALPPAHRLLLWQHAVDGRSYADIARDTARPLATVRSIALRARLSARRHLAAGEGALGLVTAFRVRLRTWRTRAFAVPAEPIAAVVALTMTFALGPAGAGAAGTQPPEERRFTTVAAGTPAAHRAAVPQSGAATARTRGSVRASARTSNRAAAPRTLPPGKGATAGEHWGTCAFSGEPAAPEVTPVIAVVDAGRYDCHVEARSTACRIVPTDPAASDVACSWSFRGDFTGPAKGADAPTRLCDPRYAESTLDLTFDGVGSFTVPVRLFLNDNGINADAELELGDRLVMIGLRIPYLCAEANPRSPLVTGQFTVV